MAITSGSIKRGDTVALDFPPIRGHVLNVNRNRSAFLVDFYQFVKWFPVHRLRLLPPAQSPTLRTFDPAPAAAYSELGGSTVPGSSTAAAAAEEQAELPGIIF